MPGKANEQMADERAGGKMAPRAVKCKASKMSDHIAFALIVYTLLLIFMVTPMMETTGMSIMPYFLLVLAVAAMVPFCRRYDRRWRSLVMENHTEGALDSRYTGDCYRLWLVALGVPALLFGLLWFL